MKAITLWQPWASLIAERVKWIETRGRSTSYRGPLAIHAAARPMRDARDCHRHAGCFCPGAEGLPGAPLVAPYEIATMCEVHGDGVPLGAVVAVCDLVDVAPMTEAGHYRPDSDNYDETHLLLNGLDGKLWLWDGQASYDVEDQRPFGDFRPGRYAWLLDHVRPLVEPVGCRGYQATPWTVPDDVAARVAEQFAA